ncbi:apolipoprotein N-acyltransferase [Demequina capsici]|uniref:Apolipoprotein N-acyltransferase n=1 Tax=Demequina capsici TaxID=3075620 RepID=A0AA96J829_9MICO|nr:apolipoprotein N-acyltransferase [Demequina sp. OYTSA14]WNM25812.1 apolipoprotein N-acyltransferase [Demequina sp. OYTSA14]
MQWNILVAVASGLLLAAAFPDVGWWPLAFVSLAGLWWALRDVGAWGGLLLGWLYGVAFFAPHVWWAYVATEITPWAALSVAEGLAWGLLGVIWAHVRRSGMLGEGLLAGPVAFGLLWAGVEQLRSIMPFEGFPWGRLAFAMADSPIAGLAWVGGVPFLGFAVATAGAFLGLAFERGVQRRPVQAAAAPALALVIVFSGALVPLDSRATDGELSVAVIQGNVPDRGLDSFSQAREVLRNHAAESSVAVSDAQAQGRAIDLMIWPENAADVDPRVDDQAYQLVTTAAQEADAPLLLGTVDYTPVNGRYNTSLLLSPEGVVLDTYSKQRPVPFAEYIPMRSFARHFSPDVDRVSVDMLAGTEPAVMQVAIDSQERAVTLATVICFEVAVDDIVREAVALGGELLVVQTNNATFGHTAESTQQLQMTRIKAIETGRYAIQDSTVGVSAIVAPDGRVLQETELFTAAHMLADVGLRTDLTPAVRFGGWIAWGVLIGAGVLAVSAVGRRLRERYEW